MRVAYVCYADLQTMHGNPVHVIEISRGLQREGHEVEILAPRFGLPPRPVGVPIRGLPSLGQGALGCIVFGAAAGLRLLWQGLTRQVDVVYSMQMSLSVGQLVACLLTGVPHVIEFQGHLRDELTMSKGGWLKDQAVGVTEWLYCRFSRHIVCVSPGIQEYLERRYQVSTWRSTVVANGVDVEAYRPMDRRKCRSEAGLSDDDLVVGFVGGFYAYHNVDEILHAGRVLRRTLPRLKLLFVGDGPTRRDAQTTAEALGLSECCLFVGRKPAAECARFINTFDVGVALHLPNKRGSSMKTLSYLACGIPVVANPIDGLPDSLLREEVGVCVPSGDVAGLAAAIAKVLRLPAEERSALAARARREMVAGHSWQAAAHRIADVLCRCARGVGGAF